MKNSDRIKNMPTAEQPGGNLGPMRARLLELLAKEIDDSPLKTFSVYEQVEKLNSAQRISAYSQALIALRGLDEGEK